MPSDVKCGLLVGIAGLVAIALLCFRKEAPMHIAPPDQSAEPASIMHEPPKTPVPVETVSLKKPN